MTSTPITVLHLCEHFGGKEASLHGVARAFQWWIPLFDKTRFRILLCSRKGHDKAAEQMEHSGMQPLYLGCGKMDPRNLLRLVRLIREESVDIIHAHGFGACMWARLAELIVKKPVIVHGRANYVTVPMVMRPVERLLGPRTRYALAVSESTRQYMIKKRYIPSDAVQTIYNGILLDKIKPADPEWIRAFRVENGAASDDKVIGVVGRLVGHKGHRDLFEAVSTIVASHPNVRVWILGDGDFLSELETWVREHNFENVVRFLGFRNDVYDVIQCFDVQVFPSHLEGTPNTLYEAMAVGNCIVAAPTDGQGEVLTDGRDALIYPVGDTAALADCLCRIFADDGLANDLRAAARARAPDFDGRTCIRKLEDLYQRIMSS